MNTKNNNAKPMVLQLLERADSPQAIAGMDDVKIMTPKKVKEVIEASGGVSTGGLNVFRSGGEQGKYTATGITNQFTIPGMDKTKEVELIINNLILVKGTDFSVNKTSGLVSLAFDLEEGEVIHYEVISTSYKMEDLDGGTTVPDKIIEGNGNIVDITTRLASPVNVEEIQGRTLVNLLGRDGSAIYGYNYGHFCTISHVDDMFKILKSKHNSNVGSHMRYDINAISQKYYINIANIHNVDVVGGCAFNSWDTRIIDESTPMKINTKLEYTPNGFMGITNGFETYYQCFKVKIDGILGIGAMVSNNLDTDINKYGYYKDLRCYEISKEIYDKINVDPEYTGDKLAEKFPYVDDAKCVVNPYIENKENLLEDVSWGHYSLDNSGINGNGIEDADFPHIGLPEVIMISPNTTYTIYNPKGVQIFTKVVNKNNITIGDGGWSNDGKNQIITFTTKSNQNALIILLDKNSQPEYSNNLKLLNDLYTNKYELTLVKGDKPKTYEECHNSRIMFETSLYEGEKIIRDNMGRYVKNSEWGELTVENEKWKNLKAVDNHHLVKFNYKDKGLIFSNDILFVYYNGKIQPIPSTSNGNWYPDGSTLDIVASLSDSLTGWSPKYTPTPEEVKAFFLGWRMFKDVSGTSAKLYDGTGTKGWVKLWCGDGSIDSTITGVNVIKYTSVSSCPTTLNDRGYTPYRLIYKKDIPTQEIIKTHGSLCVTKSSILTVSSGLVLAERVKPMIVYGLPGLVFNFSTSNDQTKLANHKLSHTIRITDGNMNYNILNKYYRFSSKVIYGGTNDAMIPSNDLNKDYFADYLIYNPDTVASYSYKLGIRENLVSVQDKLVEELSDTNLKLAEENNKLRNELEPLKKLGNPNLLINGDFQVWQRGDKFTCGYNVEYIADRWASWAGSNPVFEKINGGIKWKLTGNTNLVQLIDVNYMEDQPLVLSVYIRASQLTNIAMSIIGGTGVMSSRDLQVERFDINTEWTLCTISGGKFSNLNNKIGAKIWCDSREGEIEIRYIKLEVGEKPTPNIPKLYDEEFNLCERYYQKLNPSEVACGTMTASSCNTYISFATSMRTKPSIKKLQGDSYYRIKRLSDNALVDTGLTMNTNEYQAAIAATGTFNTSLPHIFINTGGIYLDAEVY